MAPTITDGDLVLTNTQDRDLRDGGILVIHLASMPPIHAHIRRVRQRATGVFELRREDDPEHVEFPISPDTRVDIIDRVIWSGGLL